VIIRGNQRPPRAIRPVEAARAPDNLIICARPGQVITPAERKAVNEFARHLAQKAAIEKSLARYFELVCGHYGTREVDELMRESRIKRLEHYCETCNKWVLSKNNFTSGNKVPETPLF
jgi:hypothetical protein